jgi:hypothetical protein
VFGGARALRSRSEAPVPPRKRGEQRISPGYALRIWTYFHIWTYFVALDFYAPNFAGWLLGCFLGIIIRSQKNTNQCGLGCVQ